MQQVGELGTLQHVDRESGEKGRRLTLGDDPAGAGRKLGGERTLGDARPSAYVGHSFGHLGGQCVVTAEVPGRPPRRHRAHAGADDLQPRAERLDGRHHRLEGSGFAIGVVGHQL